MPWEKRVKFKHSCRVPRQSRRYAVGSIWRCWRCGTRWHVYEWNYWNGLPRFERIRPATAEGNET